jgi:hypothetical protein
MTAAAETAQATDDVACWCCGNKYPADRVVRLGSHPEVAVCVGCAHYLDRRAKEHEPVTAATQRMRGAAGAARRAVIDRHWHEMPVIGRGLRWLDRRLPW